MRLLVTVIFVLVFLTVTFFGIGPVLFADGSDSERLGTMGIVFGIYLLLWLAYRFLIKRLNR